MTEAADDENIAPHFSQEMAWKIYGKTILVGLTYLDATGNVIERKQMRGEVIRVNPREGIMLRWDDGTEYALPPDFRSIQKANPGEYRLRSTGDVILDPDYLATYTITRTREQ